LDTLELKARVRHIAKALSDTLPADWPAASAVILSALGDEVDPERSGSGIIDESGIRGFMIMMLGEVVVQQGLAQPAVSLDVLKELTKRFTAEYAIRPFIKAYPNQTAAVFDRWVHDANPHVRRLVSEGARPRLPWSFRLTAYADAPQGSRKWLEQLVDDPSLYVRRSVANHLGDIGKDDPKRAVALAVEWVQHPTPERLWVVAHGLRYLLKQGHPGALAVLGYEPPLLDAALRLSSKYVVVGDSINLVCHIVSSAKHPQSLLIDYVVWHARANGNSSPTVFRWCKKQLQPGQTLVLSKTHSFKRVTTRRYYPGTHRIELQVNGRRLGSGEFKLNEG